MELASCTYMLDMKITFCYGLVFGEQARKKESESEVFVEELLCTYIITTFLGWGDWNQMESSSAWMVL